MKKLLFVALAAIFLLLTACREEEGKEKKSSTKQLVSFSILKGQNLDKISRDIAADIQGNEVVLSIDKYDNLNGLIAVFEFEGKMVTVDGVEQESGITSNDYLQPLNLVVEAEDGSKEQYTIKVVSRDVSVLSSFSFLKKNNSSLTADVMGIIGEESISANTWFSVSKLTPVFKTSALSVTVNEVKQVSGVTENDFKSPVKYLFTMRNGETFEYTVGLEFLLNGIPELKIFTDDTSISEIPDKDNYLNATLEIDGKGVYTDYSGRTEIKGRGNSTWSYPKKPYRLKLNKKSEICGLGEAKNFVLLANHIDPTLMLNSVVFKMGRLLDMPFTNHAIPVDVTLNGKYKGSYLLTEQVEIKKNRVDISEDNGIIWELDAYFDEDPKFKSTAFNLPVMVKDPDLTENLSKFEAWKKDFNDFLIQFAREPLEGNSYVDMIDIESVAKYLIVFNMAHNMEINHPKSIYIHKEGTGKYVMGPIWDFDWAFDYEGTNKHFGRYNRPLFSSAMGGGIGTTFFQRFLKDSRVKAVYKKTWQDFKQNKLNDLLRYVDDYSKILKPSVTKNSIDWENTRSFDAKVVELKNWLRNRATYIDGEINAL